MSTERPNQFNCPHCNYFIDTEQDVYEEATVGSLGSNLPHVTCPKCKLCCGCPKPEHKSLLLFEGQTMSQSLQWRKYPVLNDGFICLVDVMGTDASIVQAARVSYGKDEREELHKDITIDGGEVTSDAIDMLKELDSKDRNLIRYLMNHTHTTPFEMCEVKFLVRVPMDCWRQWIRHRTANVNEYSTRYTEAIDSQQTTSPQEWRLQATDNKQGSSGFLEAGEYTNENYELKGAYYTDEEASLLEHSRQVYQNRLKGGVAKEQARKDLPLSTYTEAYWKCDLHNIFNFLRLRMDSHAQYEIRMYANAMAEIVKQLFPVAWEAFEDYVLYAKKFSRMEMELVKYACNKILLKGTDAKPDTLTNREWKEFLGKLS